MWWVNHKSRGFLKVRSHTIAFLYDRLSFNQSSSSSPPAKRIWSISHLAQHFTCKRYCLSAKKGLSLHLIPLHRQLKESKLILTFFFLLLLKQRLIEAWNDQHISEEQACLLVQWYQQYRTYSKPFNAALSYSLNVFGGEVLLTTNNKFAHPRGWTRNYSLTVLALYQWATTHVCIDHRSA